MKFGAFDGKVAHYTLYSENLMAFSSERDLGITMHSSLSYKLHIQKIVNKALKMYGWLTRNLVTRDKKVILRIYKSLIRPTLEYASSVWSPERTGLCIIVEKVQRKVTKLVVRDGPYSARLEMLELPTLRWRRNYLDLLQVHRIIHGDQALRKELFTFSSEVSNASTRRHRFAIYKPYVRTDILKNHFVCRVVDHWNSLPDELLDLTRFDLFKRRLKCYLLSNGIIKPYAWNY
jgi:hypothetical protein